MKSFNRRKLITASAMLAVTALTVAAVPANAFSPKSEVGVTTKEIKLGVTLSLIHI